LYAPLASPSANPSAATEHRTSFSLPSLACIGLRSRTASGHNDEAKLKVDRLPHPRTQSCAALFLHDRFHGQSHQHCEHRSADWITELTDLNTSIQEQNNRVRQRWNTFLTQTQPSVFCFLLRLLTHLRNYELSHEMLQQYNCNASLSVGILVTHCKMLTSPLHIQFLIRYKGA
jgi:hypothetical protein